ncbi:MAG: hypothetical protein GXO00_02970 [Candidatus Diapherotrites archaeon]|nr:hypothetical protein [Candidatus Diapherotrites archaeon]
MALLISSPQELRKVVDEEIAPELYEYVRMGGILRVEGRGEELRVIYPSREMIRKRLNELKEREKTIIAEMSKLRRLEKRGSPLDLLRIKHRILLLVDKDYRELAELVDAERLLSDKRGRKIVEELQRSKEYRERIRETLRESPVYRNRRFGEFVEKVEEVKGKLLGERYRKLEESLERVRKEMEVLRRLQRWVKG